VEEKSMWSDNETDIDLCGFEFLVDQLELVLRNDRIRPVTIGLSGEWGSGKTSLMRMAQAGLALDEGFVCASFSPWRFEDYNDVKYALMSTILDALEARIDATAGMRERVSDALDTVRDLAAKIGLARSGAMAGAMALGVDPALSAAAGAAAEAVVAPKAQEEPAAPTSTADFRQEFETLMNELGEDVTALVVFVDDLDRCLPRTVIETLEAIRLFLHVSKTGYVIAADPRAVRGAIQFHYPEQSARGEELGIDYLEKMWQFTVTIPSLSVPEVETFVNLLFAQLDLDPEGFEVVRALAVRNRAQNQLAVALNHGIAEEALGTIPDELKVHFELARRIAPQLAQGLRGNPREIKRFLNTLLLRLETASKRDVTLQPDALAKLMILEERHLKDFKQLFEWQLEGDGVAPQLEIAEKLAAGLKVKDPDEHAVDWSDEKRLADWLRLEPPLSGVTLSSYFSYSRDKLSAAAPASRLSGSLQELIPPLLGDSDSLRSEAKTKVLELDPAERESLFSVALERTVRKPTADSLRTLGEIAKEHDELVDALVGAIRSISSVPLPTEAQYKVIFGEDQRFADIFSKPTRRTRGQV
jgi:hypothetical protein